MVFKLRCILSYLVELNETIIAKKRTEIVVERSVLYTRFCDKTFLSYLKSASEKPMDI